MGSIWRFIAIRAGIVVTDWKKSNVALKLSNSNRRQITPAVIFCKLNTDLGGKLSPSDVINSLTSTDTQKPLSAAQGRALANGSARDNTKLPLTGGTVTGALDVTGYLKSKNGYDGALSNTVCSVGNNRVTLIWTGSMKLAVYVDTTFVGNMTLVK